MENMAAAEQTEKIVELGEEETVDIAKEQTEVVVRDDHLSLGSYGDIDSYYETSQNHSKSRQRECKKEHNWKIDQKPLECLLYFQGVRK